MTIRISSQKASRILQHFFKGTPQPEIAARCGVNQATVSRYALKLKMDTTAKGLLTAAKEHGVMHEVDALRSLAVELSKNKLSAEEAREGVEILKSFDRLGVAPADHDMLVKVISRLKNTDFVPAAIKLIKLEASTGKTYKEVVSYFEALSSDVKKLEVARSAASEEATALRQTIKKLTATKRSKQRELQELKSATRQKTGELEQDMAKRLRQVDLTMDRIRQLEPLVRIMSRLGIGDDAVETYLREHRDLEELGITWDNFKTIVGAVKPGRIDAGKLAERLAEHGSLDKALEALESQLAALETKVGGFREERKVLGADVERLSRRKIALRKEVKQLEALERNLSPRVQAMQEEETRLKRDLPGLKTSVSTLGTEKGELERRKSKLAQEVAHLEEKAKALSEIERQLGEKTKEFQEMGAKIAEAGSRFDLFEGLLGFIGASKAPDMDSFLLALPRLVEKARTGEHDAQFLKNYVLRRLTYESLDIMVCKDCGVEFVVIRKFEGRRPEPYPGYRSEPRYCPMCGNSYHVSREWELAQSLEKELKRQTKPDVSASVTYRWLPRKRIPDKIEGESGKERPK